MALKRKVTIPHYDRIALVLQGGGALGSYQAGVYEGLHLAGIEPNWISGISIGAFNTAIIAGNPPHKRIEKLKAFWQYISQANGPFQRLPFVDNLLFNLNDQSRASLGLYHSYNAIMYGQNGFFSPRFPPPEWLVPDEPSKASFYSTEELKETLEKFCDFSLINDSSRCGMRVSVGAVNIRTGNFIYFDNTRDYLTPEHFMASGSLPPGFPPIEIDGEFYWDGGVVSNTPLYYVFRTDNLEDTLVLQVDLWNSEGEVPKTMPEVYNRAKEIQYSSRTRTLTNDWSYIQELRYTLGKILQKLSPEEIKTNPLLIQHANQLCSINKYNIIHLIYKSRAYEGANKDIQFGMPSFYDRWRKGLQDIEKTLSVPDFFAKPTNEMGLVTHDIHRREQEVPDSLVDICGAPGGCLPEVEALVNVAKKTEELKQND